MSQVLKGIRVLDFGRYIAGPFCGTLLADMGAEVIRIEKVDGSEDRFLTPISDTGEGISDALVEDIFRPFSEGADKGMGIGLSLCRSIVESHGGNLKLASARNPTVFRVTLPARRGAFE